MERRVRYAALRVYILAAFAGINSACNRVQLQANHDTVAANHQLAVTYSRRHSFMTRPAGEELIGVKLRREIGQANPAATVYFERGGWFKTRCSYSEKRQRGGLE